jgi:methionyl-tRNA formyltransferase
MKLSASAVSECASRHGLRVEKYPTLRAEAPQTTLREQGCEVMVVAAYGLILPQVVLDIPDRGCLNIHASLLPRWRGAAPIQRAILAGDAETGVCIMRMEAGLDTGPVLLESRCPVEARDTTGTLTERLARLGAEAIVDVLSRLDSLAERPQAGEATYASKVAKPEARIDWARSAAQIDRQVRAFDPTPGCEARLLGETLKVWEAWPEEGQGEAGMVVRSSPEGLVVGCGGGGCLRITRLQRPGGRKVSAADFLRARVVPPGTRLEPVIG